MHGSVGVWSGMWFVCLFAGGCFVIKTQLLPASLFSFQMLKYIDHHSGNCTLSKRTSDLSV